ncbi:uncharacterized protein LOC120152799 [Hibiscus syriacus]|uniref:uncharacterized protein LOC120152799 n=1 Tax=Hibiscus syriacus TaxID=106335 RepID=UPI0019204BBC|nr:uncharacterized protein LOC120152799 [Hibiscus syriacus]
MNNHESRKSVAKQETILQSHSSSLRVLESEVGQIATSVHSHPQGSFPSDTQEKVSSTPVVNEVRPPPFFPQRLKKHNDEIQFRNFVDILNQQHINVPLLEAIEQIPSYAKFLKDIITKKRNVKRIESVATTTKYCLAMSNLPPKKKDPDIFVIPCSIGDRYVGRALCDLGSKVNLRPKSIFFKLGMGNARPSTVILQLTDWSQVCPEGRIEDVIVKVHKFLFPADFLIPYCETDQNAPIILGRPLLAMGRIIIDCEKGGFTMRVVDQSSMIKVFNTLKYVDDYEECHYIGDVDSLEEAGT